MKKQGFTLIELLVVIAIISLLASIVVASLNTARAKARDARRLQDIHEINNAVQLYIDDNGYAPNISNNPIHSSADGQVTPEWDDLGAALANYITLPPDPNYQLENNGGTNYSYLSPDAIRDLHPEENVLDSDYVLIINAFETDGRGRGFEAGSTQFGFGSN